MKEKTKKVVMGSTAITLVSALAISGTLAYLTKQTEKRANNFTFASTALDARLVEPEWDGVIDYVYDDDGKLYPVYEYIDNPDYDDTKPVDPKDNPDKKPVYAYNEDGTPITDKSGIDPKKVEKNRKPKSDTEVNYGDKDAQLMVPGQVALKNPIIKNTGSVTDEWVAAKITFVYAEGTDNAGEILSLTDMSKVASAITIDYNADTKDAEGNSIGTWERASGSSADSSQVFYYKQLLVKDTNPKVEIYGGETAPIFTKVKVNDTATNTDIKALEDIGGFAIYIEGFAVQDIVMSKGEDGKYEYNKDTMASCVEFASDKDISNKNVAKPGIIPFKTSSAVTPTPPAEQENPTIDNPEEAPVNPDETPAE